MNKVDDYILKRLQETGITQPTIDDLNRFAAEWMSIQNNQALSQFEGYSPAEMNYIIYNLFEKNCPVQIADFPVDICDSVPLFRQVKLLLTILDKEGNIKLTQTGNLPVRLVKELYDVGVQDRYVKSGIVKLRIEKDSAYVQIVRIIAQIMRVVKKRNNKLSLTQIGKNLFKDDKALLRELLSAALIHYNPAYFDRYPYEHIGTLGMGFNLILLNKYGKTDRKIYFYAERYFNAFPKLLHNVEKGYRSELEIAAGCYDIRVIERLFIILGLVIRNGKLLMSNANESTIHRTELFEKLFKIAPPKRVIDKRHDA